MELVNVPMKEDGPDMDIVEKLVAEDDTIKRSGACPCTPIRAAWYTATKW